MIPIYLTLSSIIYSYLEILYNSRIRKVLILDGEFSESDSKLIHKDYMYLRSFVLLILIYPLIAFYGVTNAVIILGAVLNIATTMWMSIDIFAAKLMLKKAWWFIGNSAITDIKINNPIINWTLKILMFISSIILLIK